MKTIFNLSSKLFMLGLLVCTAGAGYAQTDTDNHQITVTVPNVALLDIESTGSKDITATFTAPTEAGNPLAAPANNTTLWLNYTSVKETLNRKISVSASALVPGVTISVLLAAPTGGAGTLGTVAGAAVPLAVAGTDVVTGIGSGYTGDGSGSGIQLTYSFAASDYTTLAESAGTTVTVTYTLSE